MRGKTPTRLFVMLLALSVLAVACASAEGGGLADSSGSVPAETMSLVDTTVIDYWLWDEDQQPFYEQCAADFHAANPDIAVEVSQIDWGDYWKGLSSVLGTNEAPDVFTNHLSEYPEFVESGDLLPLNDYVDVDGLDVTQYFPGLAELWTAPDGERYGLPKDFDTTAMALNEDKLVDAGLTVNDFADSEWNPIDGGTWGELVQKLSVDVNGVRGDEDGFDATNVVTYGFGLAGDFGAFGQTTFSSFAASNGFTTVDRVWADKANYADPRLAETVQFFADWIAAGYITPIEDLGFLGGTAMFQGGLAASQTNGSWMIPTLSGDATEFPVVYAANPVGPTGSRASMFNGLADSITQSAEDPDAAWRWIAYLASPVCQELVGAGAVVFPAIPSGARIAKDGYTANGVDVSAFTSHADNGTTFLFPLTTSASAVEDIIGPVMEQILRGEARAADVLPGAAEQVDEVLSR